MSEPVNLVSPRFRKDPYPTYVELRGRPPQRVQPGGLWAISRHGDVLHALKHPELFSSTGFEAKFKPPWLPHNPIGDSLITRDGAPHAKLRALVSHAFTPRSINRLEPRIRQIATECVEGLRADVELDFIPEFASSFPARVIAEILGVDQALHHEFQPWIDASARINFEPPPPEVVEHIRGLIAKLEGHLQEVVRSRRQDPKDDMVSDLIRAEVDGASLSDAEIIAFLFLLIPAGFETTRHAFATAVLAFADRPAHVESLRANPQQIPAFVEELLRHEPPVHGALRIATQEVEVGGQRIPAGSLVLLMLGSANRDDDCVENADLFDPSRDRQAGLTFGHGPHFCLGAALARMEARIGLEALLARFSRFERTSDEVSWNISIIMRGPTTLRVRMHTP